MAKPEIEFRDYDTEYEWRSVEGDIYGIKEKILSHDPETGNFTRVVRFPPGIETTETKKHDFWEEVFILEGSLTDVAKKETYVPGYYACRPPGMLHGPYKASNGCLMFEVVCYEK